MKKSAVNTTFIVMGFSLVTRLMAFVFKVFLSRTLGAEALGLFSMGLAMFGLLTMLPSSGIPLTVSRLVAENSAQNKRAHGIVTAGLLITLAVNLLTVGIFFAFKNTLLTLFADDRAEKVILIMLPATFSTCIYNVLRAYFMGQKYYVAYSLTETVEEIINILVVLILLYGGFVTLGGGETLAVAFLVGDIVCFVLIAVMFFCLKGRLAKPDGAKSIAKSAAPITLMRLFTSLAGTFTAIILPNRMIAAGLGVQESTALYGEAVGMAFPLLYAPLAITSSISIVLLPELAQLATQNRKHEIAQKVDTATLFILLITTLFFLAFAVVGKHMGRLLFDSEQAGVFVTFSAGLVMPLCLAQLTNTAMNSLGMEQRCFAYTLIGLAVMALCLWFLPSILGIYALSVAQTAFYGITVILNFVTLSKHGYTQTAAARPYAKVVLGVLPLLALSLWMQRYLDGKLSDFWQIVLMGVFLTVCYVLWVLLVKAVSIKAIVAMLIKKNRISTPNLSK